MNWKIIFKRHKPRIIRALTLCCLLSFSYGLIFGISATTFSINYIDLFNPNKRLQAALSESNNYYSQNITSSWNMASDEPTTKEIDNDWWGKMHNYNGNSVPLPNESIQGLYDIGRMEIGKSEDEKYDNPVDAKIERKKYVSFCLDGSSHSALDHSFNQASFTGILDFIENKSTTIPTNSNSVTTYKPAQDTDIGFQQIYKAAMQNSRLLIAAGYVHTNPITKLFNQGRDDTKIAYHSAELARSLFLLCDGNISNNQSVASVLFRADHSGFLTSIATCMYFYHNLPIYHNNGQQLSIGTYGGNNLPTVIIFMGGVQRGIEFFNQFVLKNILENDFHKYIFDQEEKNSIINDMVNNSIYKNKIIEFRHRNPSVKEYKYFCDLLFDEYSIKMLSLGDVSTHFSGSFAIGDGVGISKQFLNRGASAIMAVAGPQTLDTAQEIQNEHSKCIVLGVDSAMENSDYQRKISDSNYYDTTIDNDGNFSKQKNNIIKFSAIKSLDEITKKFIRLNCDGLNWDIKDEKAPHPRPDPIRAICNAGYQTCGNLLNGLAAISWDGWYYLADALNHTDKIWYDVSKDGSGPMSFENVWKTVVENTNKQKIINNKYYFSEFKNLITFDKNSKVSENYNDVISLLGETFNDFSIDFDKTMSLKNDNGNFVILNNNIKYTLIEWLDNNMYFTC